MTSNQDIWLDPISPNEILSSQTDSSWLLIDDKSVEYINQVAQSVLYDDRSINSDTSSTILEEIDEWIKEEPFSDWLEEKIDVPIFEDFSFHQNEQQQQQQQLYQDENLKNLNNQDTQCLLEEFETVLEEACQQQQLLLFSSASSTLTPPQSPPSPTFLQHNSEPTIVPYVVEQNQLVPTSSQWNAENVSLIPLGADELLNSYKKKLSKEENVEKEDEEEEDEEEEEEESSSNHDEELREDPDWIIENNENIAKSSKKQRYQPYPRTSPSFSQDKKIRKKEQNKNAATRYRQKKKQEVKDIIGEERELNERNETLKSRVLDLEREIGYLKGLMRDLFKAKGLVN